VARASRPFVSYFKGGPRPPRALFSAPRGKPRTQAVDSSLPTVLHVECYATIGQVGNPEHENVILGKAGRSRHRGIRPINRGVSKNPVDHPNGGGQGKSKSGGGWQQLMSPWGKVAKGGKTRMKYKYSNRFIVVRRNGLPIKTK